jgi:hypothetical protein
MKPKPEAATPATFLGGTEAEVRKIFERPPKPAKLICVNGKIIADAVVVVSRNDPNWYRPNGYKAYLTGDVVTVKVPIVKVPIVRRA